MRWKKSQRWSKACRARNLESMKRTPKAILVLATLCWVAGATAQGRRGGAQQGGSRGSTTARGNGGRVEVVVAPPIALLGGSSVSGGNLPDRVFDSLAARPLTARSTDGETLKVLGFTVTFAERGIYEDSAGNPITDIEFTTERCIGDTLSPGLREALLRRSKPGDTVWYDQVRVATATGATIAKGMKLVITR